MTLHTSLVRMSTVLTAGAAALALAAGPAAAQDAPAAPVTPAAAAPAADAVTAQLVDQVTREVSFVTTGERARQGDYPFAGYTAQYDTGVAALATARAAELAAAPESVVEGISPAGHVATGWAHQREIVAIGTVGRHTADEYLPTLLGLETGTPDARFELMAGPKERTAVGVARVGQTDRVVVVVVNGYATEPTAGPAVTPAPAPAPLAPASAVVDAVRALGGAGSAA